MPTTSAKKSSKSKKSQTESKQPKGSRSGAKTTRAAAKNGTKSKKAAQAPEAAGNGEAAGKAPPRRATRDAQPAKDKRQLVQERKFLRSQSRWLQKALFALGKAEDDQEKLAEVRGERHEPMAVTVNGTTHELGAVTDSLRDSVMERLEALRVTLRNEHSLMG